MKSGHMASLYRLLPLLGALSAFSGCTGNMEKNSTQDDVFMQFMSEQDLTMADNAVQRALQTRLSGKSISWFNQKTGIRGDVTPVRSYRTSGGYFCREYHETIVIGNQTRQYQDTACRDQDGIWKPL